LQLPSHPLYITGDTEVLKRIFENVIRNALTHGEGDLAVRIEKEQDKVIIEMRNRAPALQEQEILKLFERFYTADLSRYRKTTGLGLSIARRMVAMLEGQIHTEKQGDEFVLTIQFEEPRRRQ
jgi:signal transduction histidine kinase